MTQLNTCKVLGRELPALFECSIRADGDVRVRTPLLFPDGGLVDVFVVEQGSRYSVTDYGDALSWLRMQSASGKLTPNQQRLVDDVRLTLGIERRRGQLVVRSIRGDELADAVSRLAQAVVRIADIWFTFRTRTTNSVADEIDEWLRKRHFDVERSVRRKGKSGRTWSIDFNVGHGDMMSLVFLLSTGTKEAARQVSERVFTGCSDLQGAHRNNGAIVLVSLFDDTLDVWRDEDFNLLEGVSQTALWSHPDEFAQMLSRPFADG